MFGLEAKEQRELWASPFCYIARERTRDVSWLPVIEQRHRRAAIPLDATTPPQPHAI